MPAFRPAEQVVFEKSAMDSDAHLARNLFLGIVVVIGTSLTQYTYTTFGPSILKNIGLATQTSLLSTTITMLAAPLGALIGALLIEKLGRRVEVSGAFIWVAVFAFAYAMALNAGSTALITVLGFLMTIGFYVLNASVISVYVGELFSTRYRFRGAGISQGAGKAVNVVMPFAVTWILANLQPNVIYFGIVAIALVAAAVTLAIGPETKSRRWVSGSRLAGMRAARLRAGGLMPRVQRGRRAGGAFSRRLYGRARSRFLRDAGPGLFLGYVNLGGACLMLFLFDS